MKRLFFFYFVFILLHCNCASDKSNKTMAAFSHVNPSEVTKNVKEMEVDISEFLTISIPDKYLLDPYRTDNLILLSQFVDSIWAVKLDNNEKALIGLIDKIKIVDDKIYILDKHKTKSLKCFDMQGNFMHSIGSQGGGPGEFYQPTDFYVDNHEIIISDQYMQKMIFYDLNGRFLKEKKVPFIFLNFHKFNENTYLMTGPDSDNYHLDKILGYWLWTCDSTFTVKSRGLYLEKEKYDFFLNRNPIIEHNNQVYYKRAMSDSIFIINSPGTITSGYYIDFLKKTPPFDLFLAKNKKKRYEEYDDKTNYAFGDKHFICNNYLYYTFTISKIVRHMIYSFRNNEMFVSSFFVDDMTTIFPLSGIIGSTDDTLIGHTEALSLYETYNELTETQWRDLKNFKGEALPEEGEKIIELCKDIKREDNPILVFYKLK